jgi:hypothetical protein
MGDDLESWRPHAQPPQHPPHHINQYSGSRNDAGIQSGFSPRAVQPPSKRVSGKSAVAAITGVLSVALYIVFFLALPLGVVGLLLGISEYRRIAAADWRWIEGAPDLSTASAEGGKWLAVAGIVAGASGTVISGLLLLAWLASSNG